jgi:hypothetical protein
MSDLKTENIFLVNPSKIIKFDTKNIGKSKEELIITFERDIKNITATYLHGTTYVGIFENRSFESVIGNHCVEDDYYVDVHKNDIIRLREYYWNKDNLGTPLTYDLDSHILKLKPYYSITEIKYILEQYKKEITDMIKNHGMEPVKVFTYKKKRNKENGFGKNIYTDIC